MAEDPNGAFKSGFGATLGVGAGCLMAIGIAIVGMILMFVLMASCTASVVGGGG